MQTQEKDLRRQLTEGKGLVKQLAAKIEEQQLKLDVLGTEIDERRVLEQAMVSELEAKRGGFPLMPTNTVTHEFINMVTRIRTCTSTYMS